MNPHTPGAVPPPGCPAHAAHAGGTRSRPVPLYGDEFAEDPHRVYHRMRQAHGSLAPVLLAPGVPATLVIGYETARHILNSPETFPADPRRWQRTVPPDCPVLPMMEWRPNALRNDGAVHARYRAAISGSLEQVNPHRLRALVERSAITLINGFGGAGEADLITDYARPLPFLVLNELFGCPPEIAERITSGMSRIFDGVDAAEANATLTQALVELVTLKRRRPGPDVTSRLLAHEAALSDEEAIHQLVTLLGAGTEPLQNLIGNAVWLILSDPRFSGDLLDGSLSVQDALDETLFENPPMANYCITYPTREVRVDGVTLPADQPVVVSMAAVNSDPVLATGERVGNHSHLAWSTGPHACPAQMPARLIAEVAIAQLLDALPELELAGPTPWRRSPFQRALATLPVAFPPVPPIPVPEGAPAWTSPSSSTPPAVTSRANPPASASGARRRRWSFPAAWWRGR